MEKHDGLFRASILRACTEQTYSELSETVGMSTNQLEHAGRDVPLGETELASQSGQPARLCRLREREGTCSTLLALVRSDHVFRRSVRFRVGHVSHGAAFHRLKKSVEARRKVRECKISRCV